MMVFDNTNDAIGLRIYDSQEQSRRKTEGV